VIRPDYEGGSIVNLMRSLGDACGAPTPLPYAPLRDPKVSLHGTARNVVLLVLDGLGYNHLARALEGGALRGNLRASLTSTFPSTTAAAITSVSVPATSARKRANAASMRASSASTAGEATPYWWAAASISE
jgi:alkaline phosphatase